MKSFCRLLLVILISTNVLSCTNLKLKVTITPSIQQETTLSDIDKKFILNTIDDSKVTIVATKTF